MNAAIVTIGDEILIGQIIDTNSAWIAEKLNMEGIEIVENRSISDKHESIVTCLKDLEHKFDLVVITGGLGPTKDDITKNSLNEFFGGKMAENSEVLQDIESLFKARGYKVTDLNRLQATIPDNCIPLRNSSGTAPGMWFERNGTIFISMPGVPYEMKAIMENEVLPRLRKIKGNTVIIHRTTMTQGIPESYLAAKLRHWESAIPDHIKLAYLPRPGIVRLRLTAKGEDRNKLEQELQLEVDKLLNIIPEDVFAFTDTTLEQAIGELLEKKQYTLSVAESCTGGRISSLITSVPGSSGYFKGAVVAYSNELKLKMLGVDKDLLEKHGAVSEEVVLQMAEGIQKLANTDFGIATSGVAGPGGGTKEKPVGTTWIAVYGPGIHTAKLYNFGEHRGRTIERASLTALNMLRKSILGFSLQTVNNPEKK